MVADLWAAYLNGKRITQDPIEISPMDVCAMQILLKMGRIQWGDKGNPENYADIAGYAALSAEIVGVAANEEKDHVV